MTSERNLKTFSISHKAHTLCSLIKFSSDSLNQIYSHFRRSFNLSPSFDKEERKQFEGQLTSLKPIEVMSSEETRARGSEAERAEGRMREEENKDRCKGGRRSREDSGRKGLERKGLEMVRSYGANIERTPESEQFMIYQLGTLPFLSNLSDLANAIFPTTFTAHTLLHFRSKIKFRTRLGALQATFCNCARFTYFAICSLRSFMIHGFIV